VQCAKSGEPGPVIVEVPYDVLQEGAGKTVAAPLPLLKTPPDPAALDRAAELLLAAKRPGIHAGMGAAGAADLLLELALRLDAPVSTTISGRGVIPEDHDLSVGFGFGAAGTILAEKEFAGVDLVLAAGAKFSEVGSGGFGLKIGRLIHIDASSEVVGRNYPAEVGIVADARESLAGLLDRIRPHRPVPETSALRDRIRKGHADQEERFEALDPWPESVNPARLYRELRKRAPRDAILTTDSGAHTFWAPFSFAAYLPKTVLSPVDYSSMGYSIPAAIGASLAAPGRKVIAAVGDGGLLMTGTELATARRLGLPLMVVVFNDRALGLIKQTQEKIYRRAVAVDTSVVELDHFARAFGFDYLKIPNDHELGPALDWAFKDEKPLLIDARVEYREQTRHTKGTALSLIKRTPPGVILRMGARAAWRSLFD
jgi:acetolactate synthase-1/2/3 large subunit